MRIRVLATRLALACFLAVASARDAHAASDVADFEKARAAYISRNYDDCGARLRVLLDPENPRLKDAVLIAQARMYLGASEILRGHADEGARVFETMLLGDPQYDPDPLTFSGQVLEVFYDTRARIRERLAAQAQLEAKKAAEKRTQELEIKRKSEERMRRIAELAMEESLYIKNSRAIASLPFGAGQFQNRQSSVGWFFLGTEAALAIGTVVTVPLWLNEFANSKNAPDPDRARQYRDRAEILTYVNWALVGTFVATTVVGILQAHVNFVPEFREKRPRPLPKELALTPYVTGVASGVGATGGISMVF
jgi:hypothetical protein